MTFFPFWALNVSVRKNALCTVVFPCYQQVEIDSRKAINRVNRGKCSSVSGGEKKGINGTEEREKSRREGTRKRREGRGNEGDREERVVRNRGSQGDFKFEMKGEVIRKSGEERGRRGQEIIITCIRLTIQRRIKM